MITADFLKTLQLALAKDLPYAHRQPQLAENKGVNAAVLVLLAAHEGSPSVLITRRTLTVETHRGQMAFPGGIHEPSDADLLATALRETEEEIGIAPARIQVQGTLPPLHTLSTGFWIHPAVGFLDQPAEQVPLLPNPQEIDLAFWIPLQKLLEPGVFRIENVPLADRSIRSPVFQIESAWGKHQIWGATAAILRNFLDRMNRVG